MTMARRGFLQCAAMTVAGSAACGTSHASAHSAPSPDSYGTLVDTTLCIGCRKCEYACAQANALSDAPLEDFETTSVFDEQRRMNDHAFTVVNRYDNDAMPDEYQYVKMQCMHCTDAACVSACLVSAMAKMKEGPVVYDPWKCIGCRYCMVACPFEVPAYEFNDAFAPRVRKCNFCVDRITHPRTEPPKGEEWVEEDIYETHAFGTPACAEMCPSQALTFGKRSYLVEIAHQRIAENPGRYHDHVYGEHEVGGTAWMYLAAQPLETMGFQHFGSDPAPKLTENIQHGVLRYGIPPLMVFATLGALMKVLRPKDAAHAAEAGHKEGRES